MTSTTLLDSDEIPCTYKDADCQVNAISVDDLFRQYERLHFLYPEKRARIEPFLTLIKENWRRAMLADGSILYIVSHGIPSSGAWASLVLWRRGGSGWNGQHLVSTFPSAAMKVLLAQQGVAIADNSHHSNSTWFQQNNQMGKLLWSDAERQIGPEQISVRNYCYVAMPLRSLPSASLDDCWVTKVTASCQNDLFQIAASTRGGVFAAAEELDREDFFLESLHDIYGRVGLSCSRMAWLAHIRGDECPVGAIIVNRQPTGLNFSFLENRADLLVRGDLSLNTCAIVVRQLLAVGGVAYEDFEPQFLPLIADESLSPLLCQLGGTVVRSYNCGIALRPGYESLYRYIQRRYRIAVRRSTSTDVAE